MPIPFLTSHVDQRYAGQIITCLQISYITWLQAHHLGTFALHMSTLCETWFRQSAASKALSALLNLHTPPLTAELCHRFLSGVDAAERQMAALVRTYASHHVIPVIESPVSNSTELRRVHDLLDLYDATACSSRSSSA